VTIARSVALFVVALAQTACAGGTNVLRSRPVEVAPRIDGALDDTAWRDAAALEVTTTHRHGSPAAAPIVVRVQTVHTATHVFFAFAWADPSESRTIKPWVWNAASSRYDEGPDREDMFAVAFPLEGPFDADMLAPVESVWDVWQWKANRTDPAGYAMDKTSHHTRFAPNGKAVEYTARDGRPIWIARPDDAGDPLYTKRPAPSEFAGERVDQYVPAIATGSAADVRGKGTWTNGRWTLELSRALATGHPDDAVLELGTEVPIAIAVFDARGEMDRGSDRFTLALAERR
jgi:ethylbenzene dehydrogenase